MSPCIWAPGAGAKGQHGAPNRFSRSPVHSYPACGRSGYLNQSSHDRHNFARNQGCWSAVPKRAAPHSQPCAAAPPQRAQPASQGAPGALLAGSQGAAACRRRRRLLLPPLSLSSHPQPPVACICRPSVATPRRSLRAVAVATPDRQAAPTGPSPSRPSGGGSRGLQPAAPSPPSRLAFLDEDGQMIKPMPADYGFRSGSGRLYQQVGRRVVRVAGVSFKQIEPAGAWETLQPQADCSGQGLRPLIAVPCKAAGLWHHFEETS